MIQIYASGQLVYDSRLEDYDLLGLTVTTALNKGGTAEIVLPSGHPAYNRFPAYRTIVAVYRDGRLIFQGRALYHSDTFDGTRTITCEGELCFLRDSVVRPYLYQDSPAAVFRDLIRIHNEQQDQEKQFQIGVVDTEFEILDDYIRLEHQSAETVQDAINKLLERCGGTLSVTGETQFRTIHWERSANYRSDQVIEFGENLLDFARDTNTDLMTAILPYGAQDPDTGLRLTIESVNNGIDYLQDDEAVNLRGFILKPVYWDDVTLPANLYTKAGHYLAEHSSILSALSLSALDLSYLDKSYDTYQVGDKIRVKSAPHNVDEDFLLTERTEDLLFPENSSISLGKIRETLTGAGVAGDKQNADNLHTVTHQMTADYMLNIGKAIEETEKILASLIEQTSEQIRLEVSQTYTTNDKLTEAVSSSLSQFADQFLFEFNTLKMIIDENDADAREKFIEIYKYISFEGGNIKLGAEGSEITLTLQNDKIIFAKNGQQVGWWDGVDFHTGNIIIEVNERAQFGNFAFVPRSNGSLSFLKVSG